MSDRNSLFSSVIIALPASQIPADRRIDLTRAAHTDLIQYHSNTSAALCAQTYLIDTGSSREQLSGGLDFLSRELLRRLAGGPSAAASSSTSGPARAEANLSRVQQRQEPQPTNQPPTKPPQQNSQRPPSRYRGFEM